MSQKELIEKMLMADKGYDEIEDQTGSKRTYIRSVAVQYRKRGTKDEIPETREQPVKTPEIPEVKETRGMNFIDDSESGNNHPVKDNLGKKSSDDYHKAWVKKAKYECGNCGITIGKSESFCPHCGEPLIWDDIE